MAPLAPSRQVAGVIVSRVGIPVAAGQHDTAELRSADFNDIRPLTLLPQSVPPRTTLGSIEPAAIGKYSYAGKMASAAALTDSTCAFEPDSVGKLGPIDGIKEAVLPVD